MKAVHESKIINGTFPRHNLINYVLYLSKMNNPWKFDVKTQSVFWVVMSGKQLFWGSDKIMYVFKYDGNL